METSITTTVGDNPPLLETERCFQLYIAINFLSQQLQGRLTNRWKATELRLTPGDINALQHAVVIAKKQARTCAVREIQEKRDQPVAGLHTLVCGCDRRGKKREKGKKDCGQRQREENFFNFSQGFVFAEGNRRLFTRGAKNFSCSRRRCSCVVRFKNLLVRDRTDNWGLNVCQSPVPGAGQEK